MNEQRKLSAGLGCATLVAIFFVAMTVFGLAYQTKPSYFIQVGARIDRPYLVESTFFTREPAELNRKPGDFDYRFTRAKSEIDLPGIGSQALNITLRVNSAENPNPQLRVFVNEKPVPPEQTLLPPAGQWKEVIFPVTADMFSDGNLHLRLESSTWKPKNGDPRELGIVLDWVKLEPTQPGFLSPGVRPPDGTFLPLIIISVLSVLIFLTIGVPNAISLLLGSFVVAGFAYWLIADRLSVTTLIAEDILRIVFFVWVVAYLVAQFGPAIYRRLGLAVSRRESGWVAGFFLLCFVLVLGGQIHPQFTSSDIGLHVNILMSKIMKGTLVFTEPLPKDQGVAPYPPGYYIGLLPFTGLLDGTRESFENLFKISSSILQASGVFMVFYLSGLLRRPASDVTVQDLADKERLEYEFEAGTNWAGLIAAGFYAISKYPFLIVSQGNHANVFGEWAFLLCVCVLSGTLSYFRVSRPQPPQEGLTAAPTPHVVVGATDDLDLESENALQRVWTNWKGWYKRWRVQTLPRILNAIRYLLPYLALLVAFLSHYGTFLFTNVFMFGLIALLLVFGGKKGHREALYLFIIYVLALTSVVILYYYNHFSLITNQFSQVAGSAPKPARAPFDLGVFFKRNYTDFRDYFGLILLFSALGGVLLWAVNIMERRREQPKASFFGKVSLATGPIGAALFSLALTTALFIVLESVQGVESRYQLYLMPLVVLAAGALLARIWRSGLAGVLLVSALFLFQFLDSLAFWLDRITFYFY